MDAEKLVKNIQDLCKSKGTTPTVACADSGAGRNLLTNMKNGSWPSADKFMMLANYLGVTTSELLGETAAVNAYPQLSAEEEQILAVFRALDQTGRIKVQSFAEGLAAGSAKTSASEGGEQRLA